MSGQPEIRKRNANDFINYGNLRNQDNKNRYFCYPGYHRALRVRNPTFRKRFIGLGGIVTQVKPPWQGQLS